MMLYVLYVLKVFLGTWVRIATPSFAKDGLKELELVTSLYAMVCYLMLCYAMLCYAMVCNAMLCYAMPGVMS